MADAHPIRALAKIYDEIAGPTPRKIAFLNAQAAPGTVFGEKPFIENTRCEQGFRPDFLDLQRAGFDVSQNLETGDEEFDICLVLAGKFQALNAEMINRAQSMAGENGTIAVVGAKNLGIAGLHKRVQKSGVETNHYSKFHSIVFWFKNNGDHLGVSTGLVHKPANPVPYETKTGLFSAGKIDRGSALLVEEFDDRIVGKVADLGAGWGYLSCELAKRSTNIVQLDLYEAEWQAIAASRKNIADIPATISTNTHWHDVVQEPIEQHYDWVIMNPPFHDGRTSKLDLGLAFIEKAHLVLKPGGKMLMVANRHLAYDQFVKQLFSKMKIVSQQDGFKIIYAAK